MPTPPPTTEGGSLLPSWLGSTIFWIIIAAIVAYALNSYLSERGIHLSRVFVAVRDWLVAAWQWLRQGANRRVGQARAALARLMGTEIAPALPTVPWRFFRLGALSPRERVRFFYLAALRRAAEQGVKRPPAATPLEHGPSLDASWPEAQEELDYLTAEFVKARYTPEPVESDEAVGVQRVWDRVKAALRARKRPSG
jgi:hypothetical protein